MRLSMKRWTGGMRAATGRMSRRRHRSPPRERTSKEGTLETKANSEQPVAAVDPSSDAAALAQRRSVMRRTKMLIALLFVLLAIGAGRTVISRMQSSRALETGTAERAVQYVKVATPRISDTGQVLALPGTL